MKTGLYRHFKGGLYRVVNIARHSETEEAMVVYQALYGDKGYWVRPQSMFDESLMHNGKRVRRFAYCEEQTEVLEVAILTIKPGQSHAFESAFEKAQSIISSMRGYLCHELRRCDEQHGRYLLLVKWQTLEDHTQGFRESAAYQKWRELLHHFYVPMPKVEHYRPPLNETPFC